MPGISCFSPVIDGVIIMDDLKELSDKFVTHALFSSFFSKYIVCNLKGVLRLT